MLNTNTHTNPVTAKYLGTDLFLMNTPANIITTPHIADNIIAFMLFPF
jgi:hypothetical protein